MTHTDATAAAFAAAAQAAAGALRNVEVPDRPLPRLGHGIVWSTIVSEIERDAADAKEAM
jgi:hypothetical protein